MIQKKKIIGMYMVEIVCEKCGQPMRCTHTLCTYPAQYCYECLNCGTSMRSTIESGAIEYEFEEGENV